MESLYNKLDNRLNKINLFNRIGLLIVIIFVMFLIFPKVHADWVITTEGEPGILILDENGYSHWTQNITLSREYEHLDKDNLYSKWLFGLLFIFVGAFVLFDAFFNNRFTKFV